MRSADNRALNNATPTQGDEYSLLGHDKYFDKYSRYHGMTREQTEVANRDWTPETWSKLYERESNATDNF